MTWLDDIVFGAARKILNAGSELAARGGLNFASPLKATDNSGADRSDVTIDYPALDGAAVVAALPAATNSSAGKMTAAQVAALENAEIAVERTGALGLSTAQAWADIGAVVAIPVSTTEHFEVDIHLASPAHTINPDGPLSVVADTKVARVGLAITRDSGTGITVAQRDGGSSWTIGTQNGIGVRAVDGGSGTWKLQARRGALASDEVVEATVVLVARSLTDAARSGAVTWSDPDGAAISTELADHESRVDALEVVAAALSGAVDDLVAEDGIIDGRLDALEAKPFGTVTGDGALALGLQKVTGGDTYTLPALSAATGHQKEVVLMLLIAVDATITADGTDEIILDDGTSTGPSVLVPAGTRTLTLIDDGTAGVWIPSLPLAAP